MTWQSWAFAGFIMVVIIVIVILVVVLLLRAIERIANKRL